MAFDRQSVFFPLPLLRHPPLSRKGPPSPEHDPRWSRIPTTLRADRPSSARADRSTGRHGPDIGPRVSTKRTARRSTDLIFGLIGAVLFVATCERPALADIHPVYIHRSQRHVLVSDQCNTLEFDFVLGLTHVLDRLHDSQSYGPSQFYWRHLTNTERQYRQHPDTRAHILQENIRELCAPVRELTLHIAELKEIHIWKARSIQFWLSGTRIFHPSLPPRLFVSSTNESSVTIRSGVQARKRRQAFSKQQRQCPAREDKGSAQSLTNSGSCSDGITFATK